MKCKTGMLRTSDSIINMKVRTRYAPSPTGKLHIGGARTALFCFLFAKNQGGEFLLRLEDTDIAREVEGGEDNQIDGLNWLGIDIDYSPRNEDETGPFRQSERLHIYTKYINELLEKGVAYKCHCTQEELDKDYEEQKARGIVATKYNRKCLTNPEPKEGVVPTIRIKMPEGVDFKWNDLVRGEISFPSDAIGDWVAIKSNGIPSYNFANVVDDHLMNITHVMRGEEHTSNTPKQLHLYEEFGWTAPEFAHLTIITNSEGKKLSKRDESVLQFVHLYKERGYLPEAIFNFLSLLGWSPRSEEEIFTKEELISKFDVEGLSKAPSQFNVDKLKWTNNFYIKQLDEEKLSKFLSPFIEDVEIDEANKMEIMKLFQPQLREGVEIKELIKLFHEEYSISSENEDFVKENIAVVRLMTQKLSDLEEWSAEKIKEAMNKVGEELEVKGKNLMMPIRLSVSGQNRGPDIAKTIEIFGKEKTMERFTKWNI